MSETSTVAWGPTARKIRPHTFVPSRARNPRWCAICDYSEDAYQHASAEERAAFDEQRVAEEAGQPGTICGALSRAKARDLAGILARGFDEHVRLHGPYASSAVRTSDGARYEVAETLGSGVIAFVDYMGERFTVSVAPLAGGPLMTYEPKGEPR